MKKSEFEKFLEIIGCDMNSFIMMIGNAYTKCPDMELKLCKNLQCTPSNNPHCWRKYLDLILEKD